MSIPYDEASRIPLIIRYPPILPQGMVWKSGVSLVDLMPTILDAAGVFGRGGWDPSKRSLLPDLRVVRDRWRAPLVMQNISMTAVNGSYFEDRAIRTEKWKMIVRKFDIGSNHAPEILSELYDMDRDPGEAENLFSAAAHRLIVQDLAKQLRAWGEEQKDSLAVELAMGAG